MSLSNIIDRKRKERVHLMNTLNRVLASSTFADKEIVIHKTMGIQESAIIEIGEERFEISIKALAANKPVKRVARNKEPRSLGQRA